MLQNGIARLKTHKGLLAQLAELTTKRVERCLCVYVCVNQVGKNHNRYL